MPGLVGSGTPYILPYEIDLFNPFTYYYMHEKRPEVLFSLNKLFCNYLIPFGDICFYFGHEFCLSVMWWLLLDSFIWGQRHYMRVMWIKISEWVKSGNNNKQVRLGMILCFMGSLNSSFYINKLNYAAHSENHS